MADIDDNKDIPESPDGFVQPEDETGLPDEGDNAASFDPRGLPDLSEVTGEAAASDAGDTADQPGEQADASSPASETTPFIDEVDFARNRPSREPVLLESEIEQRRRLRRERREQERRDTLWNALTVIVWLAMACSVMAFVTIYTNPRSSINPFRKVDPTLVSAVVLPTPTETPLPSPTSDVPPTEVPTQTDTPSEPTATFTATLEPTVTLTPGPSLTPTIYSAYPFILRGDIKVIPAATFPDHDDCKLWVAGQVYDLQGAPMTGVTVMLGGSLDYKSLTMLSLTGTALQYGPAGYEFTLAAQPVKSRQTAWVMLFNQSMAPLSGKIYFDTVEDCQQNLILINFRQVR